MTLKNAEHPDSAAQVLGATIRKLNASGALGEHLGLEAGNLEAAAPQVVYHLGHSEIEKGSLEGLEPSGWRFLVFDGGKAVAAATVAEGDDGLQMEEFNVGPHVEGSVRAIETAETYLGSHEAEYEIRHLIAPSAYFVGKWLHSEDADDIIIPMQDHGDKNVNANQLMGVSELFDMLQGREAGGEEMSEEAYD